MTAIFIAALVIAFNLALGFVAFRAMVAAQLCAAAANLATAQASKDRAELRRTRAELLKLRDTLASARPMQPARPRSAGITSIASNRVEMPVSRREVAAMVDGFFRVAA
jgi:hypothetical protein